MTVPDPSRRSVKLKDWPPIDRLAWRAALRPGDLLDPGGVATRWAEATRQMIVEGYGHWLTWLTLQGGLDPLAKPATRLTPARLAAYLAHLQDTLAPFTVSARIQQLGNAMRAMAPEQDWRWIQRGADRIKAKAVSVRDKRARLQSPERLVALGCQLMIWAETTTDEQLAVRAVAYRDGLLIAFLAYRPIRAKNLASIQCGRHLVRRGADWWVSFPAEETKTRQALEMPFPAELVPCLEHYLTTYRPVLAARSRKSRPGPATGLWMSWHGTQMGSDAIWHQIKERTRIAFGTSLNPHLFRDCAATTIAMHAPEEVQIIRAILGHTTLATSERHYNLAGSLEAGRRHADAIQTLRRRS